YDGQLLTANWGSLHEPGVLAYNVTAAGINVTVTGTSLTLPIESASGTVQVKALGASSTGNVGSSLTIIGSAPEITSVSYASGTITVAWSTSASGTFELALFDGGGFVQSTTTGTTATGGTLTATMQAGR